MYKYAEAPAALPYRLRDDFVSKAELSLYGVLRLVAADRLVICPKVSLGDIIRGTQKCDCAPIPMADLDFEIEQRVKERFSGAMAQEAFLQRITAGHTQERRLRDAELAEVDSQLGELEEQEKKVRRDYRTDRINAEEYRDLKGEIDKEAADLRDKRQGLETAIAECIEKERGSLLVKEQLSRIDEWDTLEVIEKKNVLRFFIDRLVAYRAPGDKVIDIYLGWMSAGRTVVSQ